MKCEVHETEMEWVETGVNEAGSGYWHCERCQEEEEAYYTTPETAGTEADWGPWDDPEPDDDDYCPFCGKEYEDWSDLGCSHCDRRVLND